VAELPPGAEWAEPDAAGSVVEIGPVEAPTVSDVATFDVAVVVDFVLSVLVAAEFVPLPPPLQARAARAIETRVERYIFPSFFLK
jgi:hypothetical protein